MINQNIVDTSVFDIFDDKMFTDVSSETLGGKNQDFIEENLLHLPPLYNRYHKSFVALSYLFNIYLDSYLCIVYGLYSAGIITIGQLFEIVLKEIIKIHAGRDFRGELGPALLFVQGKSKDSPQPYLVHPIITDQIDIFRRELRNPYTHHDRSGIFGTKKVKGLYFKIKSEPNGILNSLEKAITEFERSSENHVEVIIAQDPTLSEIYRRSQSEYDAIKTAWKMYPLFSLLVDMYLTPEHYEKFIKINGSLYSELPIYNFEDSV